MNGDGTVIGNSARAAQSRQSSAGPRTGRSVEELKRNIDLLNYFYYLLSHPAESVEEERLRRRHRAARTEHTVS